MYRLIDEQVEKGRLMSWWAAFFFFWSIITTITILTSKNIFLWTSKTVLGETKSYIENE